MALIKRRTSPDLFFMRGVFFVVGPTATGKSEIAADVATEVGAEIVSADAFQIYRGLDLLTAKPERGTLAKVPHHLIGTMSILDKMSAAKFRERALVAISEIHSRSKLAIVVGGSGLYIKALTHGLSSGPAADPALRARLNELSLHDLQNKLLGLDPEAASKVDLKIAGGWSARSKFICLAGKNLGATEPNGHATFQAAASLFFANAMSFMIELIAGWKRCLRMALSKKRATPAR